jgi:hypothetical protein
MDELGSARRRFMAAGWTACIGIAAGGCTLDPRNLADAINAINNNFRTDYEAILKKNGTRVFKDVSRAEVYDAMRVSLARLGMMVETQDPVLGYVNVYAPAPLPLTQEEWRRAAEADLPRAREIIGPYVGMFRNFFRFEPEGLEIVIGGTAVETSAGVAVSYTARMREIVPPKSGIPRREYLPPTAVEMGLNKMWQELQRELDATYRKR